MSVDAGAGFWSAFQTGQQISEQRQQFAAQQAYAQQMSQAASQADYPQGTPGPTSTNINTTSDGGYGSDGNAPSPTIANPAAAPASQGGIDPTTTSTPAAGGPVADPSTLPDPKSMPDKSDNSVWAQAGTTDKGDDKDKPSKATTTIADTLKSIGGNATSDAQRMQQAAAVGGAMLGGPNAPGVAPTQTSAITPMPTNQPVQLSSVTTSPDQQFNHPGSAAGPLTPTSQQPMPMQAQALPQPSAASQPLPASSTPPLPPRVGAYAPVAGAPAQARGAALASGAGPQQQQPPVSLQSVTQPNSAVQLGNTPQPVAGQSVQPPSGDFTPASNDQVQASNQPSVGAKILNMLNPIGEADAAEPTSGGSKLPPAAIDQGTPAPKTAMGAPTPGQQSPGQAVATTTPVPNSPAAATNAPPKSAVAGAPATQGATPTPAGTTALPSPAAAVAPKQQGPTQQSEAPVAYPKDPIDPRPLAVLAKDAPEYYDMIKQIADKYGVAPDRLAAHWQAESSMSNATNIVHQNPDGSTDIGPFQINSNTMKELNPDGSIDPNTVQGGAELAARYIKVLDARFGKDTFLSVAAYNGGPGAAEAIFNGQGNKAVMNYAKGIFMGRVPDQFQPPMQVDPNAALAAAKQAGPQGLIKMLAQTNPGTSMGDKWRSLEAAGMYASLLRGDSAGAQQVRDQVLQLQNQGANQAMMGAYKALQVGNGVAAAQYLAQAHAFVPDNAMGRFGVDDKGQVWGEMLDEGTGKPQGKAFQVTPGDLQVMMMNTRDPNKFSAMVDENAKTQADLKFMAQHGDYYGQLIQSRNQAASQRYALGEDALTEKANAANTRAGATIGAALIRGPSHGGALGYGMQGPDVKMQGIANKELATPTMTPMINGIADPQQKAAASVLYSDIRGAGDVSGHPLDPKAAEYYTMGLMHGQYKLVGQGGQYFLTDPQGNQVSRVSPHAANIIGGILHPVGPGVSTRARPTVTAMNMNSSALPPARTN